MTPEQQDLWQEQEPQQLDLFDPEQRIAVARANINRLLNGVIVDADLVVTRST